MRPSRSCGIALDGRGARRGRDVDIERPLGQELDVLEIALDLSSSFRIYGRRAPASRGIFAIRLILMTGPEYDCRRPLWVAC